MALKQSQQILEAIKRSSNPLICIPIKGGADAHTTAIGLARALKRLEKNPIIVSADGRPPKNIHFLSDHKDIMTDLENLQRFVIELDASKTAVDELSYELKDDRLQIFLSPKKGFWRDEDVSISSTGFRFDLIITIGSPDLESFGHLFANNPDFFFATPIINIDRSPENEHYGQINIVDLTASACGEVCFDLIENIEPNLVDEEAATAFLSGMIAKSKSFKTPNVTPKTLQTASKLIAKGADREKIVENLYRNRSVATLRIWGRTLARLKADHDAKLVWSLISQQDFLHAGAEEEDLPDVIEELITSSPEAKIAVLLYEDRDQNICGVVHAQRPLDAIALTAEFRPAGTREQVRLFFSGKNIVQVEKEIIPKLIKQATLHFLQ